MVQTTDHILHSFLTLEVSVCYAAEMGVRCRPVAVANRTLTVLMRAAVFGRGILWDRFINRCVSLTLAGLLQALGWGHGCLSLAFHSVRSTCTAHPALI